MVYLSQTGNCYHKPAIVITKRHLFATFRHSFIVREKFAEEEFAKDCQREIVEIIATILSARICCNNWGCNHPFRSEMLQQLRIQASFQIGNAVTTLKMILSRRKWFSECSPFRGAAAAEILSRRNCYNDRAWSACAVSGKTATAYSNCYNNRAWSACAACAVSGNTAMANSYCYNDRAWSASRHMAIISLICFSSSMIRGILVWACSSWCFSRHRNMASLVRFKITGGWIPILLRRLW